MALSRWIYKLLSVVALLGLLLSPVQSLAVVGRRTSVQAAAVGRVDNSSYHSALATGLYRTTVTLRQPADWARLERVGVTVLEQGEDWALVLADEDQLETLARLRFEPRGTDELGMLVAAHAQVKPWLAASLRPLLAERAADQQKSADRGLDPSASFRKSAAILTPELKAGLSSLSSVDDDADGLTNTQEQWWCTDPLNPDSDGDGTNDGDEVQAAKDWLSNLRGSYPSTGKPFVGWPPDHTGCYDDDQDSIPDLAERWELGLNMNRESTDRDKFDDGQELFGNTYCPGSGGYCGYGALPRNEDWGVIFAEMPSWVEAPGNHPLVAAFPVPEIDVVESSLHVETVTVVTTDHTIGEGTERSYSTAKTEGTSSSVADTETWNEWQEVANTTYQYDSSGRASDLNFQGVSASDDPWDKVWETGYDFAFDLCDTFLFGGCSTAGSGIKFFNALGNAIASSGPRTCTSSGSQPPPADKYGPSLGQNMCIAQPIPVPAPTPVPCDDLPSPPPVFTDGPTCKAVADGYSVASGPDTMPLKRFGTEAQDRVRGLSGHDMTSDTNSGGNVTVSAMPVFEISFPTLQSSSTVARGSSHGTARTVTHSEYEEHTITNGEAFSSEESWGTATAVDSSHAADLWFTYQVRNTGTEYAREIGDLAFNIYIGDDPNPAITYFVAPELGGDGKFHNFMPGEEHTYTSRRIPLTLSQMRAIDVDPACAILRATGQVPPYDPNDPSTHCPGSKVRIVVEDFTYGIDELFYQDAVNAGVLVAIEDGTDDGDELIDTYLLPTWGTETVLDVLARYFPHTTDENDALIAIWTPEYRSDTPSWCIEPRRVGNTLWCKHALSTADWWNIYTNGLGDGSEGFQNTPATPGSVAFFRFNKDSDLDGYSDRTEWRLGTDPYDPTDYPKPELIAGVHSIRSGDQVAATLSLLNTGFYDAYGVEAVMIAPDDSVSITNNTVGGSGRVRALKQVIVGSRIVMQNPLPNPWTQDDHAVSAVGGYYTGTEDRTYTFTASCGDPLGCDVGGDTWSLAWDDGTGANGTLNFGDGYASPTFLDVGTLGVKLALYSGKVYDGESFTVEARTPRDTFQYTINSEPYTEPVVIVSYNDPQGNHRFVTPVHLGTPTENLAPHSGKMLHGDADVEIVTQSPFDPEQANTTTLIAQSPVATRLVDAHLFLEFIDPEGTVVREEATTVTLETGPNVVDITWNPADFNPAYDPEQDYIVMAFFTDWQGNILDTAARPLSSFQEDPKPEFALDETSTTWDFGTVPQGTLLEHTFTLANTGMMNLKATVVGTGVRTDQNVPGNPAWTDTGLDVAAGDAIGIRASGTVCYGSNGTTLCYEPDGNGTAAPGGWALPGASKFSLIARIGDGTPFFVGSAYVNTAGSSGRLYLGTNDCLPCYGDNGGTYQAHIEIQGVPTSFQESPSFSVSPADATNLDVTLDTYYLPTGSFNRSILVRTSDPAHPAQTFQVQVTIEPYVAPARSMPVSPYRPWDQRVAVSGDRQYREVVTFDDTITADATTVHPLRVYNDTRQTVLGVGREVALAAASGGLAASIADETASLNTTSTDSVFGDGSDGDLTVSSGQTKYVDNVRTRMTSTASAGQKNVSVASTSGFPVGDEVLVIQMQGTGAGNYEFGTIASIGSGRLTLQDNLQHTYTVGGNSKAQVLRVPHYRNVTVQGSGTLTAHAWNGTTGGVIAFRATEEVTVEAGGRIDVSGKGFVGGTSSQGSSPGYGEHGKQGEGTSGPGGAYTKSANGSGGGGGKGNEGGDGGGGGGNGSSGTAGNTRHNVGDGGQGGQTSGNATLTSMTLGGAGGSGGGEGNSNCSPQCSFSGAGGNGGGIVVAFARILEVNGNINADGGAGGNATRFEEGSGGGGGGAGGSILILSQQAAVGSSNIRASGGPGGAKGNPIHGSGDGGSGGVGRIRIEYCDTFSGSTNPSASVAKINFCYGTVSGKVFRDDNGNGSQDGEEPGLSGETVSLSCDGQTVTGSDGSYSLTANAPANCNVSVTPPTGHDCITPCSVDIALEVDSTTTVNFALRPRASISGKVFHDTNNSGVQDAGEDGIEGVTVTLDGTGQTRTTASDGSYSFDDLTPGNYSVTVSFPVGYVHSTPTTVSCNLGAGDTCNANFGILMYDIEKVSGSQHQIRLFMPESFHGGRRYWVQYGRSLDFTGAGEQEAHVKLPKVHYSEATMDVFLIKPVSSNVFVQINLDVGCDASSEWSVNSNLAIPTTLSTNNLAEGLNRFLDTTTPDAEGLVIVPLCVSFNMTGQLYLTNLVATPDGISDVSIAPGDIVLSPTDPVEGDTVNVQATLHNASGYDTGGLTVSFFATPPDGFGETYIGSDFVPNVSAGLTTTTTIQWNTLGFTGDVPVRVVADPYNRVAETDDDNNEATASLTILTRPDLHVTAIELSDPEPVAGQPVTVTLTISNAGQTDAGASALALYDGNPESGGTLLGEDTSAVGGESQTTLDFTWTPTAPGLHRLFAVSDRDDAVNEFDEGNNQSWQDVYVGFAGPLLLDSGTVGDVGYTAERGYGYVDEGAADALENCGSEPHETFRRDPSNRVVYRFDHLLPGHFYHLDITLYNCPGQPRRLETVVVDDITVAGPVDLKDDGEVHYSSTLLDPALYADHTISVTIQSSGSGAVVSEANLHDIDYRYVDAGGDNDLTYTPERGYGYLDETSTDQTNYGTLPYQSYREDQGDTELRYQFDGLDPAKRYLIHLTFYQASPFTITQQVAIDSVDTGLIVEVSPGQIFTPTVSVPLGTYQGDGRIVVRITRPEAGAFVNEIALEELTQGTLEETQTINLHAGWNWFSFALEPKIERETTCSGVTPTSAFSSFAGDVLIDGQPAPAGTLVEAYSPRGDKVGCQTVTTAGIYPFMRVYGEEGSLPGMRAGEPVLFQVNGVPATITSGSSIWQNDRDTHTVDLAASSLAPVEKVLKDDVEGKYTKLLCPEGTYLPLPANPVFNSCHTMQPGRGYLIYMTEPATLVIQGTRVPADTSLELKQVWNLIGYLPECSLAIETALASIDGKFDLLHGENGTYQPPPDNPHNNLHQMGPGRGYWIRMTAAATLKYPASACGATAAQTFEVSETSKVSPCDAIPTPYFTTFYGTVMLGNRPYPAGAWIEALSPRDEVVGCSQIVEEGVYQFLRVYGADEYTPGMQAGEPVAFRLDDRMVELDNPPYWQNDRDVHELDLRIEPIWLYLPLVRR